MVNNRQRIHEKKQRQRLWATSCKCWHTKLAETPLSKATEAKSQQQQQQQQRDELLGNMLHTLVQLAPAICIQMLPCGT
ncbi:uncharacterized protein LOC132792368 [Drosophila nasuta]|uniref:uncharacterized protein LOC132792368 n=1 Tax=Drosophila nasuta TaxID=42062 RepID=UPI00295E270E|nr:uncharacterized protein LOC132792368 [Drosophila nasuta]